MASRLKSDSVQNQTQKAKAKLMNKTHYHEIEIKPSTLLIWMIKGRTIRFFFGGVESLLKKIPRHEDEKKKSKTSPLSSGDFFKNFQTKIRDEKKKKKNPPR